MIVEGDDVLMRGSRRAGIVAQLEFVVGGFQLPGSNGSS